MNKLYNSINGLLLNRFGERVFKVSLESGSSCPNRDGTLGVDGCIFCSFSSYRPATSPEPAKKIPPISEQLSEGIEYIAKRHGAFRVISYFQSGSNTHGPIDRLSRIYNEAIDHPAVVGLAVSTRPDCIAPAHIDLFRDISSRTMLWVELGLQSAHDATLERIGRGHGVRCFESACEALRSASVPVCAHVILGLPGETPAMMMETARFLNRVRVRGVKIHNLHVLKGTRLEHLYNEGGIRLPSLEEYAGWAVDFLEELDPAIVVHRVNSHSPRRITVAPEWSINKLAIFNAVERELRRREGFQGKRFIP